jgi:hypothetical protein
MTVATSFFQAWLTVLKPAERREQMTLQKYSSASRNSGQQVVLPQQVPETGLFYHIDRFYYQIFSV